MHKGKEGFPSLVWLVATNHQKLIRHVSEAAPGARNDKTLSRFDALLVRMREEGLYANETFILLDKDGNPVRHKGLWIVVDAGFHRWRFMQPPCNWEAAPMAARRAERLESVRKDIEDTYGIVKQRFRILRVPMLFQDRSEDKAHASSKCHNVFKVCSMLHNMLLRHDGLADIGALESDWIRKDEREEKERARRAHAAKRAAQRASAGANNAERNTHADEATQVRRRPPSRVLCVSGLSLA